MKRALFAALILSSSGAVLLASFPPSGSHATAAPQIDGSVPLLVTFRQDVDGDGSALDTAQERALEDNLVLSHHGRIRERYDITDAVTVDVQLGDVLELVSDPRVLRAESDREVHALDAELDATWGVKRIGAGVAHAAGHTGSGARVAVLDSGINKTHVDLDGRYDASCSHDFVNNDSDPADDNGHGTHVSGTIAAEDNDTGVVGVAPGATICSYKVLGANGSGSYSGIIAALDRAVADGARVANLSLGSSGDPGLIVKQAFDNAYASGLLIVAAAGNAGTCAGDTDTVIYPARYASVIAVGATGNNDVAPCFSSAGPDVELAAPGVNIPSTWIGANNAYASASGTSMATPHVSGVAALLFGCNPSLTNVQARTILNATALDLDNPLAPGFPDGRDTWYGYGLVQVQPALAAACPVAGPTATPTNTSPPASTSTPANTSTRTATPPPSATPSRTATGTPTSTAAPGAPFLYFSLGSNGTVGGLAVANEDIVGWNGASFSQFFDGSDVGLAALTIDAFSIIGPNQLLLSFSGRATLPGIVDRVEANDIVKFTAGSLGPDTAGTFSMYFDASDVGLTTTSENVDAIEIRSNGHIILSTTGSFSVAGVTGDDKDLVEFAPSLLGDVTAGAWSLYFDGSDVGLTTSSEDIDAVATASNGMIFLSTTGSFAVPNISGADEDVFVFAPATLGADTTGTFSTALAFDGSAYGLASNDISAIDLP